MSSEFLTVAGLDAATISATEQARARRDELLRVAKGTATVTNAEQAKASAALLVMLKDFTHEIEGSRKEVKAPVIDLGKRIDALAQDLTFAVDAEAVRISKTLGAWQAEQNRLIEEQKRIAWQKEQEIRREMEEKARAAEEALRKQQAELEAKAARARTQEGRERAELEMQQAERRANEEAQRRTDEAAAALVKAQSTITIAAKPEGIATRTEIQFEVEDIVALYEAAPYLVKLEPNTKAIKAALKQLRSDQRLPGIRHWKQAVSIVR